MIQCVENNVKDITIKTVDSDVVISAVANRHYAQKFDSKVRMVFGIGESTKFYDVNAILILLGEETCKALPSFHAFSGCDSSIKVNANCGIGGRSLRSKILFPGLFQN